MLKCFLITKLINWKKNLQKYRNCVDNYSPVDTMDMEILDSVSFYKLQYSWKLKYNQNTSFQ